MHRIIFWSGFGKATPSPPRTLSPSKTPGYKTEPTPFHPPSTHPSPKREEQNQLTTRPWNGHTNTTGVAVRLWQLGLEMRPFFNRGSLWAYPVFAGTGAGFGYWLDGVHQRQNAVLHERKQAILEKRARRAAREAEVAGDAA